MALTGSAPARQPCTASPGWAGHRVPPGGRPGRDVAGVVDRDRPRSLRRRPPPGPAVEAAPVLVAPDGRRCCCPAAVLAGGRVGWTSSSGAPPARARAGQACGPSPATRQGRATALHVGAEARRLTRAGTTSRLTRHGHRVGTAPGPLPLAAVVAVIPLLCGHEQGPASAQTGPVRPPVDTMEVDAPSGRCRHQPVGRPAMNGVSRSAMRRSSWAE